MKKALFYWLLYVAVVSDTDGSAFITKAEFDSLKNNFQAQIDNYNSSIDSKIDGAIAAYLAGIQMSKKQTIVPLGKSFSAFPLVNIKTVSDLWEKVLKNVYVGLAWNCTWHSSDDTTAKGASMAYYAYDPKPGSIYCPAIGNRTKDTSTVCSSTVLPDITISMSGVNGSNSWSSLTHPTAGNYSKGGIISFGSVNGVGLDPDSFKGYYSKAQESDSSNRKINLYNHFSPAIYTWLTGNTDYDGKYNVDYKRHFLYQNDSNGYSYNGGKAPMVTLGTGGSGSNFQFTWSNWNATSAASANNYCKFPTRYGVYTDTPAKPTSVTGTKYLAYCMGYTESWALYNQNFWSKMTFSYSELNNNKNNFQIWNAPYGAPIPVIVPGQKIVHLMSAIDDFEKWNTASAMNNAFNQRIEFMSTNPNYGTGTKANMVIVPYHPWVQETKLGWCGDTYFTDLAVDSKYIKYQVSQNVDGSTDIPSASGWPLLNADKAGSVEFTVTWDDTLPDKYKSAQSKTANKIKFYVTSGAPDASTGKRTVVNSCKVEGNDASTQPWSTNNTVNVSFNAEAGKTYYLYWETEDTYFGANVLDVSDLQQTVED